ncbi:MAG: hypothetical protein ACREGF_01445, partial [Candidatus Saccharimonadales bacterium]
KIVPVTFKDDKNNVLFFGLYDLDGFYVDGLHVHSLCGNFGKHGGFCTSFFEGVAKHLSKKRVTFCTKFRMIEKMALRLGYFENQFGDMEKRVA